MAQRWIVEIVVADTWVADGFDLTDERVVEMIESTLPYADSSEVSAQVIQSPDASVIARLQSGELECEDRGEVVACAEAVRSLSTV